MTHTLEKQSDNDFSSERSDDHNHCSLSKCVEIALKSYFKQLNGHSTTNLYNMLITEVEAPLLEATLAYTHGNQSHAAEILGINRATLRKKLKTYGYKAT